jgi:TPR repeat protein
LRLSFAYAHGQGLPQSDADAVKWLSSAAEKGDVDAQRVLGLSYAHGRGVPQSDVLAYLWSGLAAAQGDETGRHTRDAAAGLMTPDELELAQRLLSEKSEIVAGK